MHLKNALFINFYKCCAALRLTRGAQNASVSWRAKAHRPMKKLLRAIHRECFADSRVVLIIDKIKAFFAKKHTCGKGFDTCF